MHQDESEFIRHIPCPQCGSSDANSLYTDGHEWCHKGCGYRKPADGENNYHIHQLKHAIQLQGSAERLQKRNISQATCELFKTYKEGNTLRHYYFDEGKVVGAKVRTKGKDFRCEGEVKTLFGNHNQIGT